MKTTTILSILRNPGGCSGVEIRDARLAAADILENGIKKPCGECKPWLPKGVCPYCGYKKK